MSKTIPVYIYQRYERFWHWCQALLILFLALTGFEIHGSYSLLGFQTSVMLHNKAAIALIILIIFTVFWHFTTGEWRQYMPTTKNLRAQAEYYLTGIFRNAPHPTRKTLLSKLNPLQRLVYLALKLIFIPVIVVSGLIFMYYKHPEAELIRASGIESIELTAYIHTLGAYILIAFVIVHVYLITTGHTITSNLRAMITGWEEIPAGQKVKHESQFTEIKENIAARPEVVITEKQE